ncbi:prepilin peptidase [Cetobacterium somerae]|uniref:prepilin peptidase n=1 Tax=Cetobacterium sp. NK01 TaxID=2993530 RepID=UPI00211622A1|nr:prepilin peptidase [Cetobacterium sp. NK01]MCQ8211925.1 prepilin peptidase [Cetobacterium sp. NK01]
MVKALIYIFISIIFIDIIIRDRRDKIILNKSNISLLFLGLILSVIEKDFVERILGAAVYVLPFILIYSYGSDFLEKDCMGVGDIKLVISLGFLLKFESFYKVLLFVNISFIIPLFFLVVKYLFFKKVDKEIAFGPFLILAYILLLFWGEI